MDEKKKCRHCGEDREETLSEIRNDDWTISYECLLCKMKKENLISRSGLDCKNPTIFKAESIVENISLSYPDQVRMADDWWYDLVAMEGNRDMRVEKLPGPDRVDDYLKNSVVV